MLADPVRDPAPFFGRDAERARLDALLRGPGALVVVRGAGGMGKSRLIRETVDALGLQAPRVGLETGRSAEDALIGLAEALRLPLGGGAPEALAGRLGEALGARGIGWVILDDAEHLAEALEAPIAALRAAAPGLGVVVGSRRALGLDGEQTVELGPLDRAAARALFEDRARAAGGVDLDARAVDALVEAVDRAPLAIELVARRAGTMPLDALLDAGGAPLRLASRPGRTGRHTSLEAVIGWSWGLLDPQARDALEQLAIFEGRFDASEAEAVLHLPGGAWAVDLLQTLRESSFVLADERGLGLLRTVRAWLLPRLEARPDRAALRARHAEAALGTVERALGAWERGGGDIAPLLAREADLRVISARLDDPATAARAGLGLAALALTRGPIALATGALAAIPLDPLPASLAARVLVARVRLGIGDVPLAASEAEALADEAVRRAAGDDEVLLRAWLTRAKVHLRAIRPRQALADATRAEGVARAAWVRAEVAEVSARALRMLGRFDDARAVARAGLEVAPEGSPVRVQLYSQLGLLLQRNGDVVGAAEAFEAAVALAQAQRDETAEARLQGNLVLFYTRLGLTEQGRRCSDRALAHFRKSGDRLQLAAGLVNRAELDLRCDALLAAEDNCREAVRLAGGLGMRTVQVAAEFGLGRSLARRDRLDEAARVLTPLLASFDAIETRLKPWIAGWALVVALRRGDAADRVRALEKVGASQEILQSQSGAGALGELLLHLGRGEYTAAQAREALARVEASLNVAGDLMDQIRLLCPDVAAPAPRGGRFALRPEGQGWTLAHTGGTLTLKDSRGVRLLALLMEHPGRPLHAAEMMALVAGQDPAEGPRRGDAGELLDARALQAYRARASALREALEEAEERGDRARVAAARHELEALEDALRGAVGRGGRARRAADDQERARVAVRARIHDALQRVEALDPAVGAELRRRVSTGTFCVFEDRQVD